MDTREDIGAIVARSPAMRSVLEQCRLYARYNRPVVLVGPVGSGKTSLAREMARCVRVRGDFVCVSAGEFPEYLFRDMLFGHDPGAFTGATRTRAGLLSAADAGVLLVDDLALLPLDVQSAILRLMESSAYRRLGDTKDRRTTCRIVVASTEEPHELVREGRMLRDLESRLGEFIIRVPGLSERPESVLPLAQSFAVRSRWLRRERARSPPHTTRIRWLAPTGPAGLLPKQSRTCTHFWTVRGAA